MTSSIPVNPGIPTGLNIPPLGPGSPPSSDEILGLAPWTFVIVVTLVVLLAAACCCLLLCMLALYWAVLGRRSKETARQREHQAALLQQRQTLERQARERQQALQQQLALQQVQQIRERAAAPNISSMAEYAWIAGRRHERRKVRRQKRTARAKARRRRRLDALRLLSNPIQVNTEDGAAATAATFGGMSAFQGITGQPGAGVLRAPATLAMHPDGTIGAYSYAMDQMLQLGRGVPEGAPRVPTWHPPGTKLPDYGDRCICPDTDVKEQDVLTDGGMSRGRWTTTCEDCGGWRCGPRAMTATLHLPFSSKAGMADPAQSVSASAVRKQN